MRPNILMPIMIFMTRYYNRSRNSGRNVSALSHLSLIFRFTIFVLIAFLTGSCEKGKLTIGGDILPAGDFSSIVSTDTLSIYSYTEENDSARTDNPTYSYLGEMYDPFFGTTTAGFVSQVRLNEKWDGKPFTVDSMKLFLHILSNVGGLTDAQHTLRISEIANQIYTDSAYYSYSPIPLTGVKLTDIALPALRKDTINDIVLDLPGKGLDFGNYLVRDTTKWFYNNVMPDFRAYFKGLYFEMDPNSQDPLMLTFSLIFDQSAYYNYFSLYGHTDSGAFKSYSLILDSKNLNAAFNVYKHDYTTATSGDKMVHRNTTYKDTLSYLQALNGVYTKVELPGLEKIKNDPSFGKVAVNRARLVVPVYFNKTASNHISTSLPLQLVLRYTAKSGIKYAVNDYLLSSTTLDLSHSFFDGKLDTVAQVYNFNIPAFVQAYLDDQTDNTKPILEIYQGPGLRNAILDANKSKKPVKFEFTYTKF
jgi:Domain of unknown function (DUF4270)